MCYPQASPWARVVEHVGDAGPAQPHLEHNPLSLLRACHTTPIRKLNDPELPLQRGFVCLQSTYSARIHLVKRQSLISLTLAGRAWRRSGKLLARGLWRE